MSEFIIKQLGELTDLMVKGIAPRYVDEANENSVIVLNQKCNRDFGVSLKPARLNDCSVKPVPKERFLKKFDVIINSTGTGTAGRVAQVLTIDEPMTIDGHMILMRPIKEIDPLYYGYALKLNQNKIELLAEGSTGQTEINKNRLKAEIMISFPKDIANQKKISNFLFQIDKKIEYNCQINRNLEEQMSSIFIEMFGNDINAVNNNSIKLGDLIECVDNRGKTPPLTTEVTAYPIIDVKALSGNTRIIDYNNCTKYVTDETYNNWFRNGHPRQYDILISTVGSLAEMKIFLGSKGCIAQNVVSFRSKGISPLYLYQYLNYIKQELVAYNIGSVQPSIKVTHIIKHSIYIAPQNKINSFDKIARFITDMLYVNYQENETLKHIREILLPKLMSGELDVSNIDI
jgi:type I restriction enzyme S subunit